MDDGATLLLNADAVMHGGRLGPGPGGRAVSRGGCGAVWRHLSCAGAGPAHCVDIADQWLACGSGVSPALLHACEMQLRAVHADSYKQLIAACCQAIGSFNVSEVLS